MSGSECRLAAVTIVSLYPLSLHVCEFYYVHSHFVFIHVYICIYIYIYIYIYI